MRKYNPKNLMLKYSLAEQCKFEVNWYRQNGKYEERIAMDRDGIVYVIGDFSWNRKYPNRFELIEGWMR